MTRLVPRGLFVLLAGFGPVAVLFINCSQSSSSSPAQQKVADLFNPPVGELVQGVTVTEGWEPLRVLPTPVNIDGGWTDSVTVNTAGNRIYFAYSKVNFSKLYFESVTEQSGPTRPEMIGNDFRIFYADLTSEGWSVHYHPLNSSDLNNVDASASLNAGEDIMIFSRWLKSNSATNGDLYYSTKANGIWSSPQYVSVNTNCRDDNGYVIGALGGAIDLYFESDRADDAGTTCTTASRKKLHIYHTVYSNLNFSAVEAVPGLNGADPNDEDQQVFISQDQNTAYWTGTRASGYGIFTATKVNGIFTNAHPVIYPNNYVAPFTNKLIMIGEANVATVATGEVMYLMCGIATSDNGTSPTGVKLQICFTKRKF